MSTELKPPNDMIPGAIHETRFNGRLVVVKYEGAFNVSVRFIETGYETSVRAGCIRRGDVKDPLRPVVFGIGFIGVGKHKASESGKHTKMYATWKNMLERCYSDELHSRYPTYKGCTVCDEWHNFQNFAEWMVAQDYDGKHLDKDIKVKGNKTYSPETCSFVTCKENVREALAKKFNLLSPEGDLDEVKNLRKFCRDNNLTRGTMSCVVTGIVKQHKGWRLAANQG